MRWEADGVVSLELESADGVPLPEWSPGAHVDVHLPGGLVRQYSLCGQPGSSSWRVAVLREPVGRGGSEAVHTVVRPGDVLDAVGPRNNFALESASSYLFIAGGIGITPLVPMLEHSEAVGASWRLFYGGRSAGSMAFADTLLHIHPERVSVLPQDVHGLLDLANLLADPQPGTLVYCCGPEPLLTAVEQQCAAAGWPSGALHLERFAARRQPTPPPDAEQDFEVVLERTGDCVKVAAGQSVLEALEQHGYEFANSCREGICGTCETAVIDGVPDHRDSLLSEDERAANDTMMICVGRARSAKLVLDL